MIETMQEVAGSALPPRYAPPDWTAGSHRIGNPGKARRLLGWQAQTSLREGLAETLRWMAAQQCGLWRYP